MSYIVNGDISGGFALVAWAAHYDATGAAGDRVLRRHLCT
jgi:hypothetical protein